MAKIRTVKPELFRHEALFTAEKKTKLPLRLAFIGLFSCCDREGRFRWRPRQIKLDVLPYDEIDMEEVLNALSSEGFLIKYQVKKEFYGCIPSWHKHQHINIREAASLLPSAEEGRIILCENSTVQDMCLHVQENAKTCSSHENHESINPNQEFVNYNYIDLAEVSAVETVEQPKPTQIIISAQTSVSQKNTHFTQKIAALYTSEINKKSDKHNASPDIDSASTCMHVGKWKGNGSGSGKEEELEGGCQGEGNASVKNTLVASKMRRLADKNPVLTIFTHWQTVMRYPQARLDAARRRIIRKALQAGYTEEQLCTAINGCSLTPHNMGQNDRGQRYDGLQVILRDADQIDRFIQNFRSPPKPILVEKQARTNVQNLQQWLDKKSKPPQEKTDE